MEEEHNSIERVVETGLIEPTFDLMLDYSELALDTFLDNETIKEIPVVKSIVGLYKGVLAIREIFLVKKLLVFLQDYHSGELSQSRKDEFLQKFNTEKSYKEAVIQQIIIMNDRYVHVEKSKILSKLFQAHVNDRITWEDFCYLSEYLDNLHTRAFKVLSESAISDIPFHFSTYGGKDGGGILIGAGIAIVNGNNYDINIWGQCLYYYGIKGDIDQKVPWEEET